MSSLYHFIPVVIIDTGHMSIMFKFVLVKAGFFTHVVRYHAKEGVSPNCRQLYMSVVIHALHMMPGKLTYPLI